MHPEKTDLLNTKLLLSIFAVAIIWGTTFLGIKIGVETIPAWFVAGIRQFLAACILLPILFFQGKLQWIGWKNLKVQIILASLMLVGANGLTTVAEQQITSTLASLITSLAPVMIFIGSMMVGLQKFSWKAMIGLMFGLAGIVFIFWDGLGDLGKSEYLIGIITLLLAVSSWSAGTVYSKLAKYDGHYMFLNLFYQFLFAGIIQLIFAFLFVDDYHFETWSLTSIGAIVYLAVFGSIIAFFAYHYILSKLLPTQVSMLQYVNTILAIFLGWLILDESITFKFIIAALLIITGVFIVNYKPKSKAIEKA